MLELCHINLPNHRGYRVAYL